MKRYAPTLKDLAPRDMVSRAISREIRDGLGIEGGDFVHLDLTHLGKERLNEKLSEISSFARIYLGCDPVKDPIPVAPTCHYMMGGIPTNIDGQVLNERLEVVGGLYAAGECSCVSVHGANRLGCNSLLDLVVFGRRAGQKIAEEVGQRGWHILHENVDAEHMSRIKRLKERHGGERSVVLRSEMQETMTTHCSVFRTEEGLSKALKKIQSLLNRYEEVTIDNRGRLFNTDLLEAIELESLLHLAEAILQCALSRRESRGAHFREDFKERDDERWLKHSMVRMRPGGPSLFSRPVSITRFEPKPRVY